MMIDTIMEYIKDYAPVVLMLVMMFIDRFGFGTTFSAFRRDVTEAFNVKKLTQAIDDLKGELRSVLDENEEIRGELKRIREGLEKVKGGKK